MKKELNDAYSFVFEEELLNEIFEVGTHKLIPVGKTILNTEEYITSIPLLLDGAIKISRVDNDEMNYYFIFLNEEIPVQSLSLAAWKEVKVI